MPAAGVSGEAYYVCQVLYERLFLGDPVRMASALYSIDDKEPLMERVRHFLAREDEASPVSPGEA